MISKKLSLPLGEGGRKNQDTSVFPTLQGVRGDGIVRFSHIGAIKKNHMTIRKTVEGQCPWGLRLNNPTGRFEGGGAGS